VKFKEPNEYSEETYGSLKKEKKPAPRKIQCVTEIMVDISDSESEEDCDTTTSHEKTVSYTFGINPILRPMSINQNGSSVSDSKTMLPPDKMDFIAQIRKRSQKGREKENEVKQEKKITESVINNLYKGNSFRMPFGKEIGQVEVNRSLESLIFKKFNNKESVNKIMQKTAKLKKNMDEKLKEGDIGDDTTGDAIRLCMLNRIKLVQKYRANNNILKDRKRGKVETRFIKLQSQNNDRTKRKTRNFNMYDQKQLDFPDVNNLINKKLIEFEFDNDIESDEDEITKSSYIRLKDLTVTLKEALNKGKMYDNDKDDLAIKKHVGLPASSNSFSHY
jgi:hypothetical protein